MNKIKLLVLTLTVASAQLFAIDGGYVGGGLGVSKITETGMDMGFGFSVQGGVRLMQEVSVGVDVQYYSHSEKNVDTTLLPVTLVGNYHFDSFLNGAFAGLQVGMARYKFDSVVDYTENALAFGANAGWNFEVMDSLTVGPRFTFLHTNETDNLDSTNFWSLLANVNYAF
jgi:opacity protein-like surface antigen